MQLNERMEMVAGKLVDGVQWGDLPWDGDFTKTLYRRLMGQLDAMPDWALTQAAGTLQSFAAASANEEIVGAAKLLTQAIDFDASPEGPDFWNGVVQVIESVERDFHENQPERN